MDSKKVDKDQLRNRLQMVGGVVKPLSMDTFIKERGLTLVYVYGPSKM